MNRSDDTMAILPPLPATIHMVGIGGIGVSGLARVLLDRGYHVTGSDLNTSPIVEYLQRLGIEVSIGHAPDNIGDAELVVTTAAARDSNPEIIAARERGIPVIKRAGLLGELAALKTGIAVAGSHGKSTTSGMLAWVFHVAGADPSYAVGAMVPQLGANAGPGDGPHFIVEADEYDYSFLTLSPDIAIITNIEHDHPDLFPDLDAIDSAFVQFTDKIRNGGTLILSADDPGCRRLRSMLDEQAAEFQTVSVGRTNDADWRVADDGQESTLYGPEGCCFQLAPAVPGAHNRMNAAMTFIAGYRLGLDPAKLLEGIRSFTGVGRRFELKADVSGVRVFDDYAHHPTELTATIQAAREFFPDATIWAVFQPHTFSRTRLLLDQFARSLELADHVVLVEIYPARETETLGVSSRSIAKLMEDEPPVCSTPEAAAACVAGQVGENDVVLVLGAGDIWQASVSLKQQLEDAAAQRDDALYESEKAKADG